MIICLTYILNFTFELLIIWHYSYTIFQSKYSRVREFILITSLYILLFILSFQENVLLNTLAFFTCNSIFFFFAYNIHWFTALFHASLTTIFMAASEMIISAILPNHMFMFYDHSDYASNLLTVVLLGKLLLFLILQFFCHFFYSSNKRSEHTLRETLILCAIPFLSIGILLTLTCICYNVILSFWTQQFVLMSIGGILLINLFIWLFYIISQQKSEEYTNMQLYLQRENDMNEYYKMLLSQEEDKSIIIHDIKKHLQTIALLNQENAQEKISSYIEHLLNTSELKHTAKICDHEVINIIMCHYQNICRNKHISLYCDIRSQSLPFVSDSDLSALLCNLMDNAIEAAEKTSDSYIEVDISHKKGTPFHILTIVNSCFKEPRFNKMGDLQSTKLRSSKHGFGMKSILKITQKYNGDMTYYYKATTHTFHTIISLKDGDSL